MTVPSFSSPSHELWSRMLWPLSLTLALAAGCASQEANLRPVEAPNDVPADMAAAYYDLRDGERALGEAKLWSRGAEPYRAGDGKEPLIHIGLRLRNDGSTPMHLALADTQLEVMTDSRNLVQREAVYSEGVAPIPPGEVGRINLWYPVPDDVEVNDLVGVELLWAVETEDNVRISRSTKFQVTPDRRYYRPHRGYYPYSSLYYDPFYPPGFYPYWSVGLGAGTRF